VKNVAQKRNKQTAKLSRLTAIDKKKSRLPGLNGPGGRDTRAEWLPSATMVSAKTILLVDRIANARLKADVTGSGEQGEPKQYLHVISFPI
jgi:hypothetical protein